MLILRGGEVREALESNLENVVETVRTAYVAHGEGMSSVPHSLFLQLPDRPRDRIIALPAYLGGGFELAGLKWISSFPGNVPNGMERAAAIIVLNDVNTGRPRVVMEGSQVSSHRTAAGAALAARCLRPQARTPSVGLIGCGLINWQVLRFLDAMLPELERAEVFDLVPGRATAFAERCMRLLPAMRVSVAAESEAILRSHRLVSFATTALQPHVRRLDGCAPGTVLLHVSLRDLAPEVVLSCDNVVDDVEHVLRAGTSLHLAEQTTGRRDFVTCTICDVLRGTTAWRPDGRRPVVYSPFGLGVLDVAVAGLVERFARRRGLGVELEGFFPDVGNPTTSNPGDCDGGRSVIESSPVSR